MKCTEEEEKSEQREEERKKERAVFLFHVCAGCLWIAAFVLQHQQRRNSDHTINLFQSSLWKHSLVKNTHTHTKEECEALVPDYFRLKVTDSVF